MSYKSLKAQAWNTAAQRLNALFVTDVHTDTAIKNHILDAVIPSLYRRARIVERRHNSRKTA